MNNEQYSQYYVAFLDILGFKDLVNSSGSSCGEILKIYKFLNSYSDMIFRFLKDGYEDIEDRIKMKIMSDSICVYTEASNSHALFELVNFCTVFQYNLLVIDPCIFIRGGITYGDMYAKDDILFGPALTEAYLLEENNAKVPRIIMCKSTLDRGRSTIDEQFQKLLDSWVFRDDDAFYTLDYFVLLGEMVLPQINTIISNWLSTTTNESIRKKYLYVEKQIRRHLEEKKDA